jgi:phenylacetate-CoA ligase
MYTRLVSNLIFPLQERLKKHSTVAVRQGLEQSQWWAPERIAELQAQRLRQLLVAAADVPYWQALFARLNFQPDAVRSVADLQALEFAFLWQRLAPRARIPEKPKGEALR